MLEHVQSIHHTFPKESDVNEYQGKSSVNQFDGLHDAALLSDQASHTLGVVRDSLIDTHGSAGLSRSHVDHSSGCQSADLSDAQQAPDCSSSTSSDKFPRRLGVSDRPIPEACGQDLCGQLRAGAKLCQSDVEQTWSIHVGEELPAVVSRETCSEPRSSTPPCSRW